MSLETSIYKLKISVPFEDWVAFCDSEANMQMNKERGIIYLYKGVQKKDPANVILIEQGGEGKSVAMFKDPTIKQLIESSGHVYYSTVISSYF